MIGTFAAILIFTMLKEGYEDIARHKSDNELNNKKTQIYSHSKRAFEQVKWAQVKAGQLIKVTKDQDFPADILLLKSDKEEGIVFVDTMQLDGETNLKEKVAPLDTNKMTPD
jgi:P-type E1-E2 ATPase